MYMSTAYPERASKLMFHSGLQVSYRTALSAVFIEGFIFVILAVTGVRTRIIRAIPKSVMLATSAGIGLYLAHIGLQQSEGLNIVTYDSATIVTLGMLYLTNTCMSPSLADASITPLLVPQGLFLARQSPPGIFLCASVHLSPTLPCSQMPHEAT